MSRPVDLLHTLYSGIEDDLIRNKRSRESTKNVHRVPGRDDDSDENDSDNEDASNIQDQEQFLEWELQIASRFKQEYNVESQDPVSRQVGLKQIQHVLESLNDTIKDKYEDLDRHDKITDVMDNKSQQRRPVSQLQQEGQEEGLDELEELDYEAARRYAKDMDERGGLDSGLRNAWKPQDGWQGWRSFVGQFTELHKGIEQNRHQGRNADSTEGSLQEVNTDADPVPSVGESILADHHRKLYELLVDRVVCGPSGHFALIQGHSIDEHTLEMYLTACPDPPEASERTKDTHWHDMSVKLNTTPRKRKEQGYLSLCDQVTRYRKNQCRLCLSFDRTEIWLRDCQERTSNPPQGHGSRLVSLEYLLQKNTLRGEQRVVQLQKSNLALQLAYLLYYLYPGPWIQRNLDAGSVKLHYHRDMDSNTVFEEFEHACIYSEFMQDWKQRNLAWIDFNDPKHHLAAASPFFLSFAQLLVDIYEGKKQEPPKKIGAWHSNLINKASEIMSIDTLRSYGEAVLACANFAIHFAIEREKSLTADPRACARAVIRDKIRARLCRHAALWKDPDKVIETAEKEASAQPQASQVKGQPSNLRIRGRGRGRGHGRRRHSLDKGPPKRNHHYRHIHGPYFTLFADGDHRAEELKPGIPASRNEFMDRLDKFKLQFLPPIKRFSASIQPIRIAILDTGLCLDDEDPLLLSGAKRVRKDLSKTFLSGDETWTDGHGHGTHVARLLLRCTRGAEIVVLKISHDRNLQRTQLSQLIEALRWAGKHADIINLSFGLDEAAKDEMQPVIEELVLKQGKLIFAAASNSGGNGKRAYPAKEKGVFAIHATNADGSSPNNMNPPKDTSTHNFATLGSHIPSRWKGQDVLISGTSYATPIAAAIAANTLEFIRRSQVAGDENNMGSLYRYGGMRRLLEAMASEVGDYNYIRPWRDGMFDLEKHNVEAMKKKLQEIAIM